MPTDKSISHSLSKKLLFTTETNIENNQVIYSEEEIV